MPLTYCYEAFRHLQGLFAKIKAPVVVSYFRKHGTESDCGLSSNQTHVQGKKKSLFLQQHNQGKRKGKKLVLPALRMHSKYKTSAWIVAGPVLFCMVWGWEWEEGKTHPAGILQPAYKQHEFKAINIQH